MICYLGSFDEGNREKLWVRVDFWDGVLAKLDRLGLGTAERTKIEKSIGRIVARVSEEEATAFKKEREAFIRQGQMLMRIQFLQRHGLL